MEKKRDVFKVIKVSRVDMNNMFFQLLKQTFFVANLIFLFPARRFIIILVSFLSGMFVFGNRNVRCIMKRHNVC